MMREQILKLLGQKGDLPPFPDVLRKLQQMINNPNASLAHIGKVIELDPVLAGSILKLASSAFYSSGNSKPETLSAAINKLGLDKIKQLAYSLKLSKLFINNKLLDYFCFWKHSLSVATFTQLLSRYSQAHVSKQIMDIAYLSGLMHDVGIMVFCYLVPKQYESFLETLREKEEPLEIQEKNCFGIDHPELGAMFVEKWWDIDPHIIHAIRFHHFPFSGSADDRQCAQLLNVADGICNNQGLGNGIDCFCEVFKEGAWQNLGLSLSDATNIIDDANRSMEHAMELLRM